MLLDKQQMKTIRKTRKTNPDDYWVRMLSDLETCTWGADRAFYSGTEMEPGEFTQMHGALIQANESCLVVSAKGRHSLVVPRDSMVSIDRLPAGEIPEYKVSKRQAIEGALIAGGLGAVLGSAEEKARAALPAIAVTYQHEGADCSIYLAFFKEKHFDKAKRFLRDTVRVGRDGPFTVTPISG